MTAPRRPGPRPGTPAHNSIPAPRWTEPKPAHRSEIEAEVTSSGDHMRDARTELRFELDALQSPPEPWVNVFTGGTGGFALPCPAIALLRATTQWLFAVREHGDHQFGLEKLTHPIYRITFCYTTFEGDILPIPPPDAYIGCTRDEAFGSDSYLGSTSHTEWLTHQSNWTPPAHGC